MPAVPVVAAMLVGRGRCWNYARDCRVGGDDARGEGGMLRGEKGVWESRGMSRPSMIFCLVGCDQENDQNWKLGRSGGRAVGVQERSGVVQKDVQGCVVEQPGGRSTLRCLLSNLRAPRFWPSDVVCGGGATGRVSLSLGPGGRGDVINRCSTPSVHSPAWRRAQNPAPPQPVPRFLRAYPPLGQSHSSAAGPGRPGRAGLDACQGSIPDLISSHLTCLHKVLRT